MNAIKRHPIFTAWIALCAILLVGGLGWTHHLRKRVRHELNSVVQKTRTRDQMLQQPRLPDADATKDLPLPPAAVDARSAPDDVPRNSLDAYIEIAGAKKALRQLAAKHDVALRADESFGFAAFAREGPRENELAAVHRQLDLVELLVGKLFAARPEKLLAVQREKPDSVDHDGAAEAAADVFRPDPRQALRVAGLIDGQSVRLEFTGQTGALRTFLNALATAPEILLARSVEVEPTEQGAKFSVVVEKIEPASSPTMAVAASNRPEPPEQWEAPASTAAGTAELFTSRRIAHRSSVIAVKNGAAEGWELLAVKRAPYRLQMVGCCGSPGSYAGTFVSPGSPDTFLARVGHRFGSLGLTVKKIGVEKYPGPSGDEVTPTAELWDERNQETVILVGRERRLTDTPLAILRLAPPPAKPGEFRTGDTFQDGPALCSIERIQLDPAEVVITRQSPGQPTPERRVLQLGARQTAPPIAALTAERRK